MNQQLHQLELWLHAKETEHIEFKEAKQRYDFEELVKYCVALANEGGGKMILGVTRSDPFHVWLTLHGVVRNPEFLRFLEKIGKERLDSFTTQDLLVIDHMFRNEPVPPEDKGNLLRLVEHGIIEQISRGRGTRYVLARQFYDFIGKKGAYTRRRGLDRETNKSLLVKHIQENDTAGSRLDEFRQILPSHSRSQIQVLLRELVKEGKIHSHGVTQAARWYSGPKAAHCNHKQSDRNKGGKVAL
jgi:ATP-dependent DNA helicase RecG